MAEESSTLGRISIRPFQSQDADCVRELLVRGYCHGKRSSLAVGLRSLWYEPICAISYPLAGLGLGLLSSSGSTAVGLAFCVFPVLWVTFWRRKYTKLWEDHCRVMVKSGDLADIEQFYGEENSGFWVAVSNEGGEERIVGCAGLSPSTELQRVSVSEDHRRRGIARLLIDTVSEYARKAGLRKIRLWSTTYQANAHTLYKRLGFVEVERARVPIWWIRNAWGHTMELDLCE